MREGGGERGNNLAYITRCCIGHLGTDCAAECYKHKLSQGKGQHNSCIYRCAAIGRYLYTCGILSANPAPRVRRQTQVGPRALLRVRSAPRAPHVYRLFRGGGRLERVGGREGGVGEAGDVRQDR